MAPDLARLVGLFGFRLPISPRVDRPFWLGWGRWRRAVVLLQLVFVAGVTTMFFRNNLEASRLRGVLAPPHPLAAVYRVESFTQDGLTELESPDRARWVRVGLNPPFTVTIQRASGDAERFRLALDTEAETLSVFDRGSTAPPEPTFTFSEPDEGLLRLEGAFEGKPTTVLLRRDDTGALLTSRPFRWINEFPFNR